MMSENLNAPGQQDEHTVKPEHNSEQPSDGDYAASPNAISEPSRQSEPTKTDTKNPRYCRCCATPRMRRCFQFAVKCFEIFAVLGGLFYAGVTYRLWRDTQHTFLVDQRAWMIPGKTEFTGDINNPIAPPKRITFTTDVPNSGHTPAVKASMKWRCDHWTLGAFMPPLEPLNQGDLFGGNSVIRPGGAIATTCPILDWDEAKVSGDPHWQDLPSHQRPSLVSG